MNRLLFAFLAFLVLFAACRHKKEVVQITTVTVPVSETALITKVHKPFGPDTTTASLADRYRFIVSFYSIGEGMDKLAHIKFITYLSEYKRKGKPVYAEETPWGREGEVDYCMQLAELDTVEQQEFISGLKAALADAKYVHFFENAPCDKKVWLNQK